ncbi:hypothetical protein [Clostridioides difficile]|uniref:hypothetical protein n=1 Tax=Clostridioides difficile TaxID=1496 RepID=UPI00038C6B68|nr:hypothetical protein [Clostridioides difficile]EGT3815294.1 hypothetical protein [Clostridioides difficile]EGT3953455.1 hypothetical protein [Clostridioides difficile]EGT4203001.1 hypothetical protein [Clostridioides difficile]EJX3465474.1 hypothetical protein [Clostridioides difficile]ELX4570445.1 hypothetical protein [Clostridioides difficile]
MDLISLISFIGISVGILIMCDVSPIKLYEDMINSLTKDKEKHNLKDIIAIETKNKKEKGLKKIIKDAKNILESTNKIGVFSTICIISLFLSIVGVFLSVSINNNFLIPVLMIGFLILPFEYVKFAFILYKKKVDIELSVALSMITTSYMRNSDIVNSIEESVNNTGLHIRKEFECFLNEVNNVNSSVELALKNLKSKFDNDVFEEWITRVIACQSNQNLKAPLSSTIERFASVEVLNKKKQSKILNRTFLFIIINVLIYFIMLFLKFINEDWANILYFTSIGKLLFTLVVFTTFLGVLKLFKLYEPSNYKDIIKK